MSVFDNIRNVAEKKYAEAPPAAQVLDDIAQAGAVAKKKVAEAASSAAENGAWDIGKKGSSMAGAKIGAAMGYSKVGGAAGGLAAAGAKAAFAQAPKEAVKASVGAATSLGIKEGTKLAVEVTARQAAVAGATEATKQTLRIAAAKGAASAAAGGFSSLAGELAGGYIGKRVGASYGGEKGARLGGEIGAFTGATGVGAGAGALVGGPAGAAAGAAIGAAGYGLGKATEIVIDKAATWEGIAIVQPRLQTGWGSCKPEDAVCCIIAEESIGRCAMYCYPTTEEAETKFKKMMLSRILFKMQRGKIVGEERRGGWPWHQSTILLASQPFRADPTPPTRQPAWRWTELGVTAFKSQGMSWYVGDPAPLQRVTQQQLEAFESGKTSVEKLAELGYLDVGPQPIYKWTDAGVQASRDAKGVFEFLGNPVAGDILTDEQALAISQGRTSLEELFQLGYFDIEMEVPSDSLRKGKTATDWAIEEGFFKEDQR